MAKSKPVLEDGNIESFRPQRRNLNKHKPRGMSALEASMRKHGYVAPMTAAADGELLDGSARLEMVANVFDEDVLVIRHDGTKPVIMVRTDIPNASTNEARAISAEANRIAQINLDWDAAELLADLNAGIDFSGMFDKDELDGLLSGLVAPKKVEDPGADVSKADELQKKWNTSLGQTWQLGAHRLICGDCTDKATVERLMGGEKASMMVTDPPYGVEYEGVLNDEPEKLIPLLNNAFSLADVILKNGAVYYICFPDIHSYEFAGAIRKIGWRQARPAVVLWLKDTPVMGRGDYNSQFEQMFYGWKGEGHLFTGEIYTNVWEFPRPKVADGHPTMKPVEFFGNAIKNSSRMNDIVYEPFSGSGTTLIACEQLSRQCRAIELDSGYSAITLERFYLATGIMPVLISDGA